MFLLRTYTLEKRTSLILDHKVQVNLTDANEATGKLQKRAHTSCDTSLLRPIEMRCKQNGCQAAYTLNNKQTPFIGSLDTDSRPRVVPSPAPTSRANCNRILSHHTAPSTPPIQASGSSRKHTESKDSDKYRALCT